MKKILFVLLSITLALQSVNAGRRDTLTPKPTAPTFQQENLYPSIPTTDHTQNFDPYSTQFLPTSFPKYEIEAEKPIPTGAADAALNLEADNAPVTEGAQASRENILEEENIKHIIFNIYDDKEKSITLFRQYKEGHGDFAPVCSNTMDYLLELSEKEHPEKFVTSVNFEKQSKTLVITTQEKNKKEIDNCCIDGFENIADHYYDLNLYCLPSTFKGKNFLKLYRAKKKKIKAHDIPEAKDINTIMITYSENQGKKVFFKYEFKKINTCTLRKNFFTVYTKAKNFLQFLDSANNLKDTALHFDVTTKTLIISTRTEEKMAEIKKHVVDQKPATSSKSRFCTIM